MLGSGFAFSDKNGEYENTSFALTNRCCGLTGTVRVIGVLLSQLFFRSSVPFASG